MSQETISPNTDSVNALAYEYAGVFEPAEPLVADGPKGLDFSNVRIHVLKAKIDDLKDEYCAVFEHEPLKSESFMNLLSESAPSQNQSSYGVLDDWSLPDRTINPIPLRNPTDKLLSDHVQALKQHWADFEGSRYLFMRALSAGTDHFERNVLARGSLMVKFLRPDEVETLFQDKRSKFDYHTSRRVFETEGLPSFVETTAQYLAEDGIVSARDAVRIAQGKTRKIAAQLFQSHGKQYASRYFDGLSEEQKAVALQSYSDYKFLSISTGQDEAMFIPRNLGASAEDLAEAYGRRLTRQLPKTGQDVDVATVRTRDGQRSVVFAHTLRDGVEEVSIQPVLTWQTKHGADGPERELIVDAHDPKEFMNPKRHVYESVIGGLLCTAYLSPEIRNNSKLWPNSMRFPGGKRDQGLGAAQVPVLALMRRNQLLSSELIENLEAFAT